jgi:hypothetical protein
MAVFKATQNRSDSDGKFKATERRSYDSALVYDWETRNKEAYDALEKYRQRINSGGYLSADDLTAYRKALDSYVETSTSLRGLSKGLGQGKDDDNQWTKTIADMETGYKGISDYFSQWKTEDAFKASLAAQKDREQKLSLDTNAYRGELEALEKQRDELIKELDANDSSIGTANVDKAAMDLVAQIDDLEKKIQERKLYLSEADRLQEGVRLASVSGNTDFHENSGYVSTEYGEGFSWDKLFKNDYGLGYGDLTYEYINNQNGIRAEIDRKSSIYSNGSGDGESRFKANGYDLMHEDEIAIYNYYYAKEGKEAAEKYLSSIQETLNARKAAGMYENLEDNFLLEMAFGVVAGIDQFKSGMEGLADAFTGNDEYKAPSATQMASGMVREDLSDVDLKWYNFKDKAWGNAKIFGNSLGQAGYDAVTTTANMLPSILTSAAVNFIAPGAGSYVGTTLLGASAGGNAYREMINLGYDKGQARAYAALVGGSEAIMQSLLGGISSLSGGGTDGIFQSIAGKLLPHVDKAFARTAIKLGANMLDEGLEEGLQEILTPWFQNLVLNADAKVDWSEVAYSSLLGALTAGIMEGPGTIAGEVNAYTQGRKLLKSDFSAERLAEIGKTFSADTVAYQLAGKVNENTSAYTIGRLFNEIGATMTEQNVNDITNALVAKGWDEATAKKNAEALAYVIEGGQLTDSQIAFIEANETLAEAARTALFEANTTWNQRAMVYNDAVMALAQEQTGAKSSRTNPAGQSEENAPTADTVDALSESGVESASGADTGLAKFKSIASIKNKRATLAMEDGTEADARDVDLDPDDGVRIETIASIDGITSTDANFILKTLRENTGASAQMDALGAKDAYRYGFYGFSKDLMTKQAVFANSLTQAQRDAIYEAGKNARQSQIEKASPKTTAKQRGVYFDYGGGNVVAFKDADKSALTEEKRKAGVQVAMILNKLGIGGSIYFFESYRNAKGQLVYKDENGIEKKAPNGWYSEKDGSIHIDLNSGRAGNGLVLYTLSHELTHFIEQWSPKKYKVLADFLIENYEKGQSMDALVRKKQANLSKLRGEKVEYQEAYSEVIADSMEAMLSDGNVLEKLIELKAKDQSLFMKMKQFFDNLLTKIRNAYKGQTPDSVEGNAVLEMTDAIERIQQLFAEALVEASENFQSAMESVVETNAEAVAENEILTDGAVVTDGNGKKYSIKSMKHDIAEGQMFEDLKKYCGWSQKQVNDLRKNLTALVEYMTPFRDILDMNEAYDREGRRFSPYKPNSDPLYKISMDFSTLCSKRLLTQYVIEKLQLRENRPMSAEEQMAIRDMLIEYRKVEKGLQVACAMCYVEAARLKSPKQIQKWLADPAAQMKNYFADKDPEFSAYIKEKQSDFKESRGYARNATKKDMKAKDITELNKIRPRLRSQYQVSAEEQKIIDRAVSLPNSTFLTAGNLASLSESDPVIYSAYTAFVRTATRSKSLETDEPYYYGDSTRDNGNGIVVTDSFIEEVNRENGMRFSSWSDWRIQHLLDYITAVIDNSVRGAAMHGYTKFGEEVRVLGKTGMMFNMSGVPGSQTGLNEDGSLNFSPTESMDVDEAIQLREEFPEHAGLQCIGVSDDHIIALLRSDIIDYVIPYHTSGLNAVLRRMVNIFGWDDYTGTQHAAIDKSIKFEDAVDQEHWHEEPVYSEFFVGYDTGMTGIEAMRESAARYVQMCKDRGLKPKFEKFVKEENYWKLLIDRKMINQKTGKLIQQKPVTPTFDFDTIKEVVDRHVKNYDSNLEARAFNHIVENWDSIPQRIKDLKKQGGTKAKKTKKAVDTLANQTIAAQPKEAGIHNSDRDYSYEALTSKPDMMVTDVGGNVPKNRADVVAVAKKNAASVGRFDPKTGSVSVHVNDMDVDVLLGTDGLKHGLRRTKDAQNDANYIVTVKAGEILKNSIKVNEITPKKHNATGSYVLIGIAKNASGDMYIVRSVVNQFNNELASMDVLYAINAKKELAATKSPRSTAEPLSVTSSSISITELLDIVNQHFPDILPEDVLKHYGYDARPEGDLGENVLYSDRDYLDAVNRGDMETAQCMVDEAAKKAGLDSLVYHGTPTFGFTKIDVMKSDDQVSFFATDSLEVAETYSGKSKVKGVSDTVHDDMDAIDEAFHDKAIDLCEYINRAAGYQSFISYDAFEEYWEDAAHGTLSMDWIRDSLYEDVEQTIQELFAYSEYYDRVNDEDVDQDELYEEFVESEAIDRIYSAVNDLDFILRAARADNGGNYQFYANTDNLFELDAKGNSWARIPFDEYDKHGFHPYVNTRQAAAYAKANGFDGVKVTNVFDDGGRSPKKQRKPATVYIFFTPQKQVKSADPVTYDDSGNVIPLSERFNQANDDIRYSSRDIEAIEFSDAHTQFSLREEAPPKRTIKAYKVFRVADGKLYPPKIANLTDDESLNVPLSRDPRKGKSRVTATGNDTPVGVWINADVGGIAVDENGEAILNTNGRIKVYDLNGMKGDGRFDEKTTLAFRPGWHLGSIPEAIQFLLGDGTMPDDLVYAECEIAADIDYQAAAMSYGVRPTGKFVHADAGLPAVPVDGYYKYKTNPKTDTHPWFISGAIKVNRIIGDAERRAICAKEGITIAPRYSGKDIEPTDIWENGQPEVAKDLTPYKKSQKNYDNEQLLAKTLEKIKGLSAGNPKLGYIQRELDFNSQGILDEIEKAKLDVDALRSAYEKHGFNPYYFDTDEEVGSSTQYSDRIDTSGMDENAQEVIRHLEIRASSSRYRKGAYASYSAERIVRELERSSATKMDYAKSYIAWVEPLDFLYATTTSQEGREQIEREAGELDLERLRKQTQPIHLTVDFETGKIVGHEGRHRMIALHKAGVERVAVIFDAWNDDRYNTKPVDMMMIGGQEFSRYHRGLDFFAHDMLPLSKRYADAVRKLFSEVDGSIRYSERDTDSVSNRSLLANAFEGVAQNASEKQKIQEYKSQISLIEAEERKLSELNQKIKDLSFAKGPKDTKAIRDLQFEARQTANRINTMDKILLRLEASKPLQDVLTREKEMVRKREQQKGKEALEAYREKATKTQRELLEKWQESRKKGIDSRQRTAMRHKIKDIVNELNQYLLKGTKDRHVPIGLQKAVAEALNAVNMDTVGADERIAKLNDELLKAKTPEAIQEISKRIDNIRQMGDRMDDKLKKLKSAYDEFIDSDDPLIANSHDDAVAAHMMRLIVQVGDTPLRDMTMDQLQAVYDVYKIVLATIRNANKSFKDNKNREISTRANQVMAEIDNLGVKRGKRPVFMDWVEKFGWDGLKPVYAMEHIGSQGLIDAYNNVRAGEDTWAKDIVEAREYYLDKFRKYKYDSWDFEKKVKFTSTTGKDFELTLDQIMSLYAFSKRDQAADHLKYGGIVFDPKTEVVEKTKSGIKVKYNVANATAYNISEETLADIISKLTADQKAFVDEMQSYLSDVMGAKGNEVSLAMYDVKLFREKHYFPLKSAHQYMAKAKEQAQGDVKIKNSGFSKETKPHAKNPIVLSSFMDVWTSHVNEMSMYHAFVLPMEDFYRIYNYATPSKNENMPTESVNAYIENAYGAGATGYIEQMLKDLNGGARTDSRTGIINKLMGLYKKGAVFASLSVVVQQPSAIARAAALVDTKYFIGPKVDHKRHKALWDEVKQYAPVAIIKEMGYFDTNMGKSTQDYIMGQEYSGFKAKMKALVTDSNYRDEILSKAPALADEIAWCSIWEAVKRETQAKYPGLDVRGEPFLMLAGSRFTEVITKTQVYDSVLSRSAMMRSKDTGMKMATAFMAEPTTSINMIADALLQGKRGNKKYARAAIGAVIASQIINSILVSFVYAGRDDDEDETYVEKYIGTLTGEILDSLNPATYIPFVKDIVSIVQGYDVERSDMAVVSDLWNAWKKLSSDNVSVYRKVEGFAGSIAQLFGLPLKNIMRDVRGIYQTIMSFVSGPQTTAAGIGYAVKSALPKWMGGGDTSNQNQLYDAYLSGDKAQIARAESRYKDQSSITSAIRKALRENDPRILEAAQAVEAGNAVERARIAREIESEGHFKLQDIQAAINAEIDKLRKEAKGK